jgi:hypothetical protein
MESWRQIYSLFLLFKSCKAKAFTDAQRADHWEKSGEGMGNWDDNLLKAGNDPWWPAHILILRWNRFGRSLRSANGSDPSQWHSIPLPWILPATMTCADLDDCHPKIRELCAYGWLSSRKFNNTVYRSWMVSSSHSKASKIDNNDVFWSCNINNILGWPAWHQKNDLVPLMLVNACEGLGGVCGWSCEASCRQSFE